MEEILRQADWLMEQNFAFVTVGIWSHAVRYISLPFSWDACPERRSEWIYMLNRQEYLKKC